MTYPAENPISFFARTNFRNQRKLFGIKYEDRFTHLFAIGKTGTGKSSLLETLIRSDLEQGHGVALCDPHGDLIERVLAAVPESRKQDLIYFNVPDSAQPLGFNPLEFVAPEKRPLVASHTLEVFKKIWSDSWGPRLEHLLRNSLLVLLDRPGSTLADILHLLDDKAFRKETAAMSWNPQVRNFWLREYENYPARFRAEAIAPLQNKVGAFLANPVLQQILIKPQSNINLRRIMDERKILLVNLAKGKIGEDTSALLGALLVSEIGMAAISRTELPEEQRQGFFVYLDEFPIFTTLTLANMLSELRKYRVGMILAEQYLSQNMIEIRDAILGNAGTIISFRVGLSDAELLAKEFYPEITPTDLVNLPNHTVYLKLMVDGVVSRPFSAETLRPSSLSGS